MGILTRPSSREGARGRPLGQPIPRLLTDMPQMRLAASKPAGRVAGDARDATLGDPETCRGRSCLSTRSKTKERNKRRHYASPSSPGRVAAHGGLSICGLTHPNPPPGSHHSHPCRGPFVPCRERKQATFLPATKQPCKATRFHQSFLGWLGRGFVCMHVRRRPCYVVLQCSSDPCAPRRFLPDPVTVSAGQEVALGCVSHSLVLRPEPSIGDDPGERGKHSMPYCVSVPRAAPLTCRPLWVTHFALQSSFQLTPLGRCRMLLPTSARLGDSSRPSRRYGARVVPDCRSLLISARQRSFLPFEPLYPLVPACQPCLGPAWGLGADLKGFFLLIGQTHQPGAPALWERLHS